MPWEPKTSLEAQVSPEAERFKNNNIRSGE
jgi:hypothetical protein